MKAICLNCSLKRSPEESSAASLSEVVMSALRDGGVETDAIRLVDHRIEPGSSRRPSPSDAARALQAYPIPARSQS
jgi:hypothetical protein